MPSESESTKNDSSIPPNLSLSLLYEIMVELGTLRNLPAIQVSNRNFEKLIWQPELQQDFAQRGIYIGRHLDFLEEMGYVRVGRKITAQVYAQISLTVRGQVFVQPELAEFGQQPMLPQVVKSLEDKIQVLTYPQEEKEGMLYRLREAVAKQAPDVIAKVIIEVSNKILTGGA